MTKIKGWIKAHKIAFGGIVVGIVIVGLIVYAFIGSFLTTRRRAPSYWASKKFLEAPSVSLERELDLLGGRKETGGRGEIEVKEGSMEIKSKNAEGDFAEIKSLVENYQGYIERSYKSSTNLYLWINLTLRVPSEKLLDLVEEIKRKFEVKSYNIRNYRISIERELDEFEILKMSLSDYEKIREEIRGMVVGKDKIELLMKLTEKELELKRREKSYQREISFQERRGEYATLQVSIKQRKSPKILPENVWNEFKDRIRRALENVVDILKDLIGGGIELFFKAIQLVVYLFIIAIVIGVFYKLARKLFRRLFR
ncbi:DUF4349 domain-containing protein [bacterium]|nr:DUF4349 domain-containing protein [bacterium]